MTAHLLQRRVEVRYLVERADLRLVGEEHVDVVLDQIEEGRAMPVHAEGIGEGQRHLASGGMRDAGGDPEGLLGRRRVEEIALEVQDLPARDHASSRSPGPRCTEAPRKVCMVRWASGVMRMRQRPVGGPPVAGGVVYPTPVERRSWANTSPSWSSRTLPT